MSALRFTYAVSFCAIVVFLTPFLSVEPKTVISGRVTLDGKPLNSGHVTLQFQDGRKVEGEIKDGVYTLKISPTGEARITIVSKPRTDP